MVAHDRNRERIPYAELGSVGAGMRRSYSTFKQFSRRGWCCPTNSAFVILTTTTAVNTKPRHDAQRTTLACSSHMSKGVEISEHAIVFISLATTGSMMTIWGEWGSWWWCRFWCPWRRISTPSPLPFASTRENHGGQEAEG